jgi:hypothetical protein
MGLRELDRDLAAHRSHGYIYSAAHHFGALARAERLT